MKTIFNLIVHILEYLSSIFKVSYVEMNIIIYYIIIPITWALIDDSAHSVPPIPEQSVPPIPE